MAQPSKRDAILATAGELFIAHGFSKVSIDQIAAAVPVSKPTLYAHFLDKRALYSAVIEARCQRKIGLLSAVDASHPVDETLFHIGYTFLAMVLSKDSLAMHRTLTAEIAEFPEIGKLFYHSGPEQMIAFLTEYLNKMHTERRLTVADAALSSDMFLSMIKGNMHLQCLLGVRRRPTQKAMRARVGYAVEMFLKAHGAA